MFATIRILPTVVFAALAPCLFSAQPYTFVSIPANNCIQTDLISTFPEGTFIAANALKTPFKIATSPATCGFTGAGPCNFNDSFGGSGDGQTIVINVSIPAVKYVFTLMNAYSPNVGAHISSVEFVGSGGAKQTFPLIAGKDIRDFYQGNFANTLNNGIPGVYALNAFECSDPSTCLGSGGSGNVNTGLAGQYVVDEQVFALSSEFATQTLVRIIIADTNNGSTPLLLGITTAN